MLRLKRFLNAMVTLLLVGSLPAASPFAANRAIQHAARNMGCCPMAMTEGREELEQRKRDTQLLAVNIGKTLDTLRADIPNSLHEQPDLSVFKANVRLSDPSGVKLQGIGMYDNALRLLRTLSAIAFHNSTEVSARFFYDEPRLVLKAKLNAQIQMKTGGGPQYLCVVSYYHLCETTGKVQHHVVDRVDVDGTEVDPFHLLADRSALSENWLGAPAVPTSRDTIPASRPARSFLADKRQLLRRN